MPDFVPELIARPTEDLPELPDQPPEVDADADPNNPNALPDLAKAAERVLEWVGWFGDGRVDIGAELPAGPGLFSRDLEVIARAAEKVAETSAPTPKDTANA